jgi:N-acylglucosamine 2-epimerase
MQLQHSVDAKCGGFFNCLDEDGAVYDASKNIWLQGRQTWMFAKIANLFTDDQISTLAKEFHRELPPANSARSKIAVEPFALTRDNLKKAAIDGANFLRSHAVRKSDGQIYFCLSREGKPVALQVRWIRTANPLLFAYG